MFGMVLVGCGDKDTKPNTVNSTLCTSVAVVAWADDTLTMNAPMCAGFSLAPRVLGEGSLSVDFVETDDGWQPEITASTDAVFRGLVLEGTHTQAGSSDAVLWRQGYQSWSFSGVVALMPLPLDDEGVPEVGGDGDAAAVAFEKDGTSWWMGAVGRDDGASIFVGALSALRTRFFVAFDEAKMWAVWGHRGDEIALSSGETMLLDPVWFSAGSDAETLSVSYGEAAARRNGVEAPESRPPTGWATWYHFFEDITEEEVRENLDVAQALPSPSSEPAVDVFQIDDGWQKVWGDWTADEGFPSGMASLAEDMSASPLHCLWK